MRSLLLSILSRRTIRQALYALVFCAICPALMVIVFYGGQDYRRTEFDTRSQALNLAKSIASQQQVLTESSRILLHTLARLPAVMTANAAAMHQLFKELRAVHPNYANISFVDMNGYLVSSSNQFTPPVIAYDRKYFIDAVRTKQFSAGEYVVGRVVTEPIIQFSAPVFTVEGGMTGVLVLTVKLNQYDKLFSDVAWSPAWRFGLLDHNGTRLHRFPVDNVAPSGVLASPSTREALEASGVDEGIFTAIGPDGIKVEYAFVKLRLSPRDVPYMTVVVGVPAAVLSQVFASKIFPAMALMFAVLGLALVIAHSMGKMAIGSGLDRLTQATRNLTAGDLSFRIGTLHSCQEVRELGQAFDTMAETLSQESAERRQAEYELAKAKSYIANILDSMPSVVIGVDPQGTVTHWNKAAEDSVGLAAVQALGQPLEVVFPRLDCHLNTVQTAMRERRPQRIERELFKKGNEPGYQDVMIYPLVSNGVEGAVVRVDDVTQRVQIEEMMVQSEKMTSVGGLAAGMAHEINNPLGGILQSAQVVISHLSMDVAANRVAAEESGCSMESIRAYAEKRGIPYFLEGIRESGLRAAHIVRNMLEFSRKSQSQHNPTDINALLDKAVELGLSDYDLKKKYDFRQVQIVREYGQNLPEVSCTHTEIEQVILNLLKNAAQAMTLQKDRTEQPTIFLRTASDGAHIRIEVEDNGPGMPEAVRKRIFEPFYTTKPVGEGTGLGLSVSYFIIVTSHGGHFDVESQPGKGTRFIMQLPLSQGHTGVTPRAAEGTGSSPE